MVVAWPSGLSTKVLKQGYTDRPLSMAIRSKPDGPARQRRRFTAGSRELTVRFRFSAADAVAFMDWGEAAAIDGNALTLRWFDFWLKGIDNGLDKIGRASCRERV